MEDVFPAFVKLAVPLPVKLNVAAPPNRIGTVKFTEPLVGKQHPEDPQTKFAGSITREN